MYKSHGSGKEYCYLSPSGHDYDMTIYAERLKGLGQNTTIETTVRIFTPERVSIGDRCYLGHNTILKAHPETGTFLEIGNGVWMEQVYINAAGGVKIEDDVGIGPGTVILSSEHESDGDLLVMKNQILLRAVLIERGADIGAGSCILPGVIIGEGSIVGMGSVVTQDVSRGTIVAGNPARLIRARECHSYS